MKKILLVSASITLLLSCSKKQKEDLDAQIQYRVYCNLSPTNDTLFAFYIPTGFTPNGDGINEIYFAKGTDIDQSSFEMEIFYRTGNQIFYSNNINKGWDGRANSGNETAPVGAYNYIFKLKDNTGESYEYIGSFMMLK